MKWRAGLAKVKHSLGCAYEVSSKVLSAADRAHVFLSKGYNTLGGQFELDVRQRAGGAL